MKRSLLIIVSVLVIICSFFACKNNSSSESVSTTAVTDAQIITRYYKAVTDENKETVSYNEGKVVTTELIKESTAIESKETTSVINRTDNDIAFDATTSPSSPATKATISTTVKNTSATHNNAIITKPNSTTQTATDKDGWIDKWY